MHIKNTSEFGTRNFCGTTFHTNINVVVVAGLERGPERPLNKRKEEDVGSSRVRLIKHDHLSLMFKVSAIGANPVSCPPDLKPEYAHKPYAFQFPNRDNMPVCGFFRFEPNKESGNGGIGRGSDGDVIRDIREKDLAIGSEV
jgi:hypothetical protein